MYNRQSTNNVPTQKMSRVCSSCGCTCEGCFVNETKCSLDLHQRIEELQSQLLRSHAHMSQMEVEFTNRQQGGDYQLMKLREEIIKLRDRYERLLESHKRLQRVNDSLESKLLKVVNLSEGEKTGLQKELASLTSRLVETRSSICDLQEENERYRADCNLAVQLLHCKPSNFVAHRLDTLPLSLQERVKDHMTNDDYINMDNVKTQESTKLIHVPMQTFPPTAMVYSVPNSKNEKNLNMGNSDHVSMSLIAKVLTQPEIKRNAQRSYVCVKCREDFMFANKEVQTVVMKDFSDWSNGHSQTCPKVHRKVRHQSSSSSTEPDI